MTQPGSRSRNRRTVASLPRYAVKAVDKALRILEAIGTESSDVGLVELSRRLEIEKSTLHRLLGTLERREFVHRDPSSRRYSLGIRMLELGTAVTSRSALARAAAPVLDRLAVRSRQTVNLAVLDKDEILYLAKRESPEPLQLTVEVGRRLPAHCTALGKAILAFRPAAEIRRFVAHKKRLRRLTANTIVDPRNLLRELAEARRTGIAEDREELVPGLRCLAAPVIDFTGVAVAALSISMATARLSERRVAELRGLLLAGAAEVSTALRGPKPRPAERRRRPTNGPIGPRRS